MQKPLVAAPSTRDYLFQPKPFPYKIVHLIKVTSLAHSYVFYENCLGVNS